MRLIRDWEKGGRGYGGGENREVIYLSLYCHRQNDSSIKMGSDESHFNVGFIVRDKVTRHSLTVRDKVTRLSTNHNLFGRERRAEAQSNRGPSQCMSD